VAAFQLLSSVSNNKQTFSPKKLKLFVIDFFREITSFILQKML